MTTCTAIKERSEVNRALVAMIRGSYELEFGLSADIRARAEADVAQAEALDPEHEDTGPILWVAVKNRLDILHGIVNEYLPGGDQLTASCDCGEHVFRVAP